MLKLDNLSKNYPTADGELRALDHINLTIARGEIVGLIGRSGSGKSTLVKLINCLETPSNGEVWLEETALTQQRGAALRQTRSQIGVIFQHFNLLSSRTVFDNVALPLEILKRPKAAIHAKVTELLALVGLTDRDDHTPDQLSGGQKQRVAIARALAGDPKLLLCDEATSALDPEATQQILELLETINRQLGLSLLLVTHEMDVIKRCCQRVGILERGKLVETGKVLDIFTRPEHEATRALVQPSLHQQLPDTLRQRLRVAKPSDTAAPPANPVIRLSFVGEQVDLPVLALVTEKFALETSVIAANIDWVQDTAVGTTLCELLGAPEHHASRQFPSQTPSSTKNGPITQAATKEHLAANHAASSPLPADSMTERQQHALDYIRSLGIQVEVLGYVDRLS